MPGIARLLLALACGGSIGLMSDPARAAVPEWNPVRSHAVQLGPEASRLVVGFRATEGNTLVKAVRHRTQVQSIKIVQANTSEADVAGLAQRTGLGVARSRQMTPSMHVVFLQKTLYGADVNAALKKLRHDPAVEFAEVRPRICRPPTRFPRGRSPPAARAPSSRMSIPVFDSIIPIYFAPA